MPCHGTDSSIRFSMKSRKPARPWRLTEARLGAWSGRKNAPWAEAPLGGERDGPRSEEHTSELQSRFDLVCRLLLEKKKRSTKHKIKIKTQNKVIVTKLTPCTIIRSFPKSPHPYSAVRRDCTVTRATVRTSYTKI